ncbi:hypothetical protein MNB_SM-7-1230 [hydrothermal vent metagenome]|uniref:Uncharacterized protein n=1 Tax=hydrothermal vent metagenome TaxID=652676 RepID=A0A1W1BFF0_9ZZZZ
MKKLVTLSLLAATTLLQADMSQQEFLYKDPRMMGMGAANTAVGGYSTAIFYNPAGLINIKKSHGVEVELLGIALTGSKDIKSFSDDLSDADTDEEVIDVTKKYSGEAFNITASNYTSFSYHAQSDLAYSIGLLASADVNYITHDYGGPNGILETHSRAYGGVLLGAAQKYDNILGGRLTVGLGLKFITQKSYEAGLDAGEVYEHKDDLATYIQDTYEVSNSGFGADIGVLYEPNIFPTLHPTIGLSLMNIGSLNFDDAYGAQPMTLNGGISIAPEISWLDSLILSIDYVDMLHAQQARVRNYNPYRSDDQYDNADIEFDAMQHLRAGLKVGLFDNKWITTALMGGWYEGAYTAGVDIQLTILKIQAATYQEQLGAKTGQLEDRRYMVGIGIGW